MLNHDTNTHSSFRPHGLAGDGGIREAVGLFTTSEDLQSAIRALEGTAFPRQDISVMGQREDLERAFGTPTPQAEDMMDNSETPRMAPSRPEEQTIGNAAMVGIPAYIGAMGLAIAAGAASFPAVIAAAVIGGLGGGTVGGVISKLLNDRYHERVEEQIRQGGLLLWVRTPDEARENIAFDIMHAHNGRDVHIHETV